MQVNPWLQRSWGVAVAVTATLALSACGGGGASGGPAPAPAPEIYVNSNAWHGAVPLDAETLSADEFRGRVGRGELHIVTSNTQQAQRTARQRQFEQDRAFLEGLTDRSDALNALLAEVSAAGGPLGDRIAARPNGQTVTLLDLGSRLRQAAESHRRARDAGAALDAYALAYSLLPADLQPKAPAPATLRNANLEQIRQAARDVDGLLASLPNLDNARLDPAARPATARPMSAGNGADNTGACTPTGLHARYWWPLKGFVSPVKDQGQRGTCWAFTAVAAVESRERVQNNYAADVSEQFLVNKVKREWEENDFVDGGSALRALNAAVDHNQPLAPESAWTYNRATGRPNKAFDAGVEGTAASYSGTCNGYTGICSETAHQSRRSCTSVLGISFCGHNTVSFNGPGVGSSRVRQVWASGQDFNLNQYRALLAGGYSLLVSFPVYEGIMAAPNTGIVSDYSKKMRNAAGNLVDGSYGGHLSQIVGFLSNEELSFPGSPVKIGGGGYFVLRNSWGCGDGDGGYFYVPADYVSSLFSTLEVLDFDARRSDVWKAEQVFPGGTQALTVSGGGSIAADLRVENNLAGKFTVAHPVATYVRLTVTSHSDGVLYDGQWMVNAPVGGSLFGNWLPVTFQSAGLRTLTITARYGAQVVSAHKDILVINSAPTVGLDSIGAPQQNENYVVSAVITDRNEPDPGALCGAMSWAVDAPDAIVSGSGCSRTIRFGAQGARQVRVATSDREGVAGAATGTYFVAAPPVNPYPRITTTGVYERKQAYIGGRPAGCFHAHVPDAATIDLRLKASCGVILFEQPTAFLAKAELENPGGEALSYDWTYAVYLPNAIAPSRQLTTRTTAPSYDMLPFVFGGRNADERCTITLRVNAPDPARSKTQAMWSGRCINIEDAPR